MSRNLSSSIHHCPLWSFSWWIRLCSRRCLACAWKYRVLRSPWVSHWTRTCCRQYNSSWVRILVSSSRSCLSSLDKDGLKVDSRSFCTLVSLAWQRRFLQKMLPKCSWFHCQISCLNCVIVSNRLYGSVFQNSSTLQPKSGCRNQTSRKRKPLNVADCVDGGTPSRRGWWSEAVRVRCCTTTPSNWWLNWMLHQALSICSRMFAVPERPFVQVNRVPWNSISIRWQSSMEDWRWCAKVWLMGLPPCLSPTARGWFTSPATTQAMFTTLPKCRIYYHKSSRKYTFGDA